MSLNLEQTTELLQSLSRYFELKPFSDSLARLELKRDITTNGEGGTLPAGEYLIDADGTIYDPETEGIGVIQITKLSPLRTAYGEVMKLANLIFYIGEYMRIPDEANAILGNYFPKDPLAAALQDIVLPQEVAQPIDRLTRQFFKNLLPLNPKTYKVPSGELKGEPIAPKVAISLLDLPPGIDLSRDITPFDSEVFTAITSLFDVGTKRFTGHDIYRVMTGNPRALATPEKLQAIDESWTRLTSIAMKLDTGNMGNAYHFIRWVRDSRVIEGRKDTVILRNQHGTFESTLYSVTEEPTLKTYADALHQVLRYPLEARNTPVNKTRELIIIQNYLLQHISAIPKISNHIRYDAIFSRVNLEKLSPDAQRRKRAKLRAQISKMLNYWTQIGLISSWEELKQNGAFYCIVVDKPTGEALPPPDGSDEGEGTPKKTGTPP